MKRYGIFMAYPPTVDMGHEGLGRYLAAFLRGAAQRDDVRFVVVCPSWSQAALERLLTQEGVPRQAIDIRHPGRQPLLLRAYDALATWRSRRRRSGLRRVLELLRRRVLRGERRLLRRLAGAVHIAPLLPWLAVLLLGVVVATPLVLIGAALFGAWRGLRWLLGWAALPVQLVRGRAARALAKPEDDGFVFRLYKYMEEAEARRMLALVDGLTDVRAWYCPTAFWPAFNAIRAPKLLCVPDVVLRDFAIDFSRVGGDRFLTTFAEVEASIRGGSHFVTYSEGVKWQTLVDVYAVAPERVDVVRHAPNMLAAPLAVSHVSQPALTMQRYAQGLLMSAISKASHRTYASSFAFDRPKFLFYASQFRPNKNVVTLLRAYAHLLRTRRITHKLLLTGKPDMLPAVRDFIATHGLANDVLCMHGLTLPELAACYHLADLAVNPSLSEGGCPFTFTEALSVGTPVVMARIAVTEEVLVDPALREATLFDPTDWRDAAARIEWALAHRDDLLALQMRTYAQLAARSWTDVVDEHVAILDRISAQAPRP